MNRNAVGDAAQGITALTLIKTVPPAPSSFRLSSDNQICPALPSPSFTFLDPNADYYGSITLGLMKCVVLPPSKISSEEMMCGSKEAGLTTARITAPSAGAVKSQVIALPRASTTSHDFLVTNRRAVGQAPSSGAARLRVDGRSDSGKRRNKPLRFPNQSVPR